MLKIEVTTIQVNLKEIKWPNTDIVQCCQNKNQYMAYL